MRWKILQPNQKAGKTSGVNDGFKDLYPDFFKNILLNRGIENEEEFLKFAMQDNAFHSPMLLYGIEKAIQRIVKAEEQGDQVYIYGDYDVDGVTATSLLWDFLYRKLKIKVLPYIPSRFEEGYGMSEFGLDTILENNGKLVITVDCGIRDIELVKKYSGKGLDFIITDHHTLPKDENGIDIYSEEAVAVIHPRHPKGKYPFAEICGAAVAWKFVCAISESLKLEFDPKEYLDLVSIATITDIMPLIDENRSIVKQGLNRIKRTQNVGLRSLMLDAAVDVDLIDTYHYGFVLGPRLNAAGRVSHAMDGVRLLTTNSPVQAAGFAKILTDLNKQRQDITQTILVETKSKILDNDSKIHIIFGEGWSEGVVGLVAGKLQEEFYKPILVGTSDGEYIVGSARSISEFNVTEALEAVKHLLDRYGGHAQAAGFKIHKDNVEEFITLLTEFAEKNINSENLIKILEIDAILEEKDLSFESVDLIESLRPFGYKNKRPILLIKETSVISKSLLGKEQKHVKLKLRKGEKVFEAIAFNGTEEFQRVEVGDIIDVAGTLERNTWNNYENLQFKLVDFKTNEDSK